ncbi:DUF2157 domain-containing protein [Paraglaciecola sp. MB-3u-78]|jgi:uncharacterized membrane protein|uniref:DUF2157 domain-containing protein n=1 Tax=Paraglaciecola sp. MB-3u-78 TaxID=2058332 RepID=UPI000C33459C|nr:DUF2157 domain-containing protein [Paraglaciecola sp. MB-3u-78]PKG97939.1 DUF2157 domain-containing protein [Paraglaciecola sp. MB-3u-78]
MSQRELISQLIEQGKLATHNVKKALFVSHIYPSPIAWRDFIARLLLWSGALAMGFSLIFFVAANWQEIGRFAKFALFQVLIVLAIVAYLLIEKKPLLAQVTLTVAFLSLGALMAFFGQTYQTGADPWQLFFNWAVLGLPWVIISRFAPLWIVWLALLNLSIWLYHDSMGSLIPALFERDESMAWSLFLLNSVCLFFWELRRPLHTWLNHSWAPHSLALATTTSATSLALMSIFDYQTSWLGASVWLAFMALAYLVYRLRQPDLFMLALGSLSGIVVVVSWVANIIAISGGPGAFLLLFVLTIGLTTGAALWLKKLMKEFQ